MALAYTHRRHVWLAGSPWQQPARFDWDRLDYIVVHYPGCDCAPDGDIVRGALEPSDIDNLAAFIRRNHLSYLNSPSRGYNLGYSIGFDWLGGTWEIRGDEYRCAANAPAAFNARAIAFYVITDIDGAMTDFAVAAVSDMVAQVRRRRPLARLIPHGDGPLYFDGATRTACPSNVIRARITGGEFDLSTPTTPSPTEEDDMRRLIWFRVYDSTTPARIYVTDGLTYRCCVEHAGTKLLSSLDGDPVPITINMGDLEFAGRFEHHYTGIGPPEAA